MSRKRRPTSVRALVGRLTSTVRGLRVAQSIFAGVAAAAAVHTASVVMRQEPFSVDGWILAGALAVWAGGCWMWFHPTEPAAMARRVDRGLGAKGAFETAWEAESLGGGMSAALSRRALEGLERESLHRAAYPGSVVIVAVALLSVSALVIALERSDRAQDLVRPGDLASSLANELETARAATAGTDGGGFEPDAAEQVLRRLAVSADRLARVSERGEGSTEELRAEAERMMEELDELARQAPLDSAWRKALDSARITADALRDGLGESSGDVAAATDSGPDAGSGGGAGVSSGEAALVDSESAGPRESIERPERGGAPRIALGRSNAALVEAWAREVDSRP